jgi:hypothetical protein
MTRFVGWLAAALGLAVLATVLIGLAYQVQPALHLTIGDETVDKACSRLLRRRAAESTSYLRWTRGASRSPYLPGGGPYRLAVEMAAPLNRSRSCGCSSMARPSVSALAGDFRRYSSRRRRLAGVAM